jgi:CO dehydrogenase maturation factor
MKVAITGKGGVGKTTIAAYLSKTYAENGFHTIAVDADPSLNLASFFGREDSKPISEIKDLVAERAMIGDGIIRMNPDVRDLIDSYGVEIDENLKLLISGTVRKAGSGCLCPENALLRALLQELVLERDDAVILDMEAGLEIMSRGTIKGIDAILAVTEPSHSSVQVTKRLLGFAGDLGIENLYVIANKIKEREESEFLNQKLEVFHQIPYSKEVSKASMDRDSLYMKNGFYRSIFELYTKLNENSHT